MTALLFCLQGRLDDLKAEIPSLCDKSKLSETAILSKGKSRCQFGQQFFVTFTTNTSSFVAGLQVSSSRVGPHERQKLENLGNRDFFWCGIGKSQGYFPLQGSTQN
jgi:hypothetical protein